MKRVPSLSSTQIDELSGIINCNKSSFTEGKKAQAILMLSREKSLEDIRMVTGYSKRHVFTFRKAYFTQGLGAIKDKQKKGRALLTSKQRQEILDALINKKPLDFGYSSDFWTTSVLARFIKDQYNVNYKSKTSIHLLFKEAKFTYHKPDKKYQRRSEEEVKKWLDDNKSIIQEAWDDPDTVILTEDEMILSTQTTCQKIWLPSGQYPKIDVATKRQNRSIYGFLNIKTGREHAFKTDHQNMHITEKILKKVRKQYPRKKILLLWDQAGWHRGSVVQKYIEKSNGKIKTIFFPAGAPEFNPQEHVWKAGRSQVTHNKFIENIDKAADQFVFFLNEEKFDYSLIGLSANLG